VTGSCKHGNDEDGSLLVCCAGYSGCCDISVAVSTPEKSVNFYPTTRRNNPEDSRLHTRCRENLKSHILMMLRIS
jgi:hypothetical protein